jgi:hypothetical protein
MYPSGPLPVNIYSIFSVQVPFEFRFNWKTSPAPPGPPYDVVLYRFPAPSKTRPAKGVAPSELPPLHLYKTLSVQVPCEFGFSLNTTPQPPVA